MYHLNRIRKNQTTLLQSHYHLMPSLYLTKELTSSPPLPLPASLLSKKLLLPKSTQHSVQSSARRTVNSQLVAFCQLGFLILLCCIWIICFQIFEWSACKLAGQAKCNFHYKQAFNLFKLHHQSQGIKHHKVTSLFPSLKQTASSTSIITSRTIETLLQPSPHWLCSQHCFIH